MYNTTLYNGKPFEYKDGFISDLSGYMVGMPRIRQLRVKPGNKKGNIFLKILNSVSITNTKRKENFLLYIFLRSYYKCCSTSERIYL